MTRNFGKLKIMGIWIIVMAIFIGQLFLYAWCRVQCIQIGYEISQETDNHEKLITMQNKLRIELASLKSPERIAKIAKGNLGLAMPTPDQIIIIP
ncbi:MAG: hypothetical protein GY749_16050 [Desulfobacteraceae bacterium]|nr:hypothetical protein [Desulfobacteraceae bacterium]MCP4353437.1 hypothetical protein [Desulfobacterales bacterium]